MSQSAKVCKSGTHFLLAEIAEQDYNASITPADVSIGNCTDLYIV